MKGETIFGIHAVTTILETDITRVRTLIVQKNRQDKPIQQLLGLARKQGIGVQIFTKKRLDELTDNQTHQGVAINCLPLPSLDEKFLEQFLDKLTETPLLLILDAVTDPHNLGACLRTANAAGVHAVIAPKDKSAPLTATVAKVASGAVGVVPYVRVTNLARTLKALQERGIWLTGTAGEAERQLYQTNLTGPSALIMGAEGKGLRRLTREYCDQLIKIPMAGTVSSLNVSVATGVCLFEIVRQRQTTV